MTLPRPALTRAIIIGTVAQLTMVIVGHFSPAIAQQFAVGGMLISLLAGVLYTLLARGGSVLDRTVGGLIAGGLCALIGIAASYALGDVQAIILVFGTLSSAATGAIGGSIGSFFLRRSPARSS